MDTLKKIITHLDIRVNAREITITYDDNRVRFWVTEENKIKFDTDLTIGGSGTKSIEQKDDLE